MSLLQESAIKDQKPELLLRGWTGLIMTQERERGDSRTQMELNPMQGGLNALECLGNGGEGSSVGNRIMTTVMKLVRDTGGSEHQVNEYYAESDGESLGAVEQRNTPGNVAFWKYYPCTLTPKVIKKRGLENQILTIQ